MLDILTIVMILFQVFLSSMAVQIGLSCWRCGCCTCPWWTLDRNGTALV